MRLPLDQVGDHRRSSFTVSGVNAAALAALDRWPNWPGGALALVGPEGAGKTHLARDWADRAAARTLTDPHETVDFVALADRPVLIDDADRLARDETLFHLLNRAALGHGTLLLTGRSRPAQWTTELADLRSRLNALAVAELGEPDDAVLEGVLRKFFRQRNIRPADDLLPYLVRRIERSIPRAREVVSQLDEVADEERRPITRALARRILDGADEADDPEGP